MEFQIFLLILGSSFRADRACRKRKFQLLNKIQQQLTSVTRYIDVITTNFSKKMPNYATKHPVAYRTWSRLTNLIFARFSVVRWDWFRKFRAIFLHNFKGFLEATLRFASLKPLKLCSINAQNFLNRPHLWTTENHADNQIGKAGFRPLCNKILLLSTLVRTLGCRITMESK